LLVGKNPSKSCFPLKPLQLDFDRRWACRFVWFYFHWNLQRQICR
jgi:hypothetical protein